MTALAHVEPEHHFVEHGGEVEVELAAESEIGIFAAGLDAFAELVVGSEDGEPMELQIALRGRDRTLLLIDWLNELLFLGEVEQFVPTERIARCAACSVLVVRDPDGRRCSRP
ncbi:MAG TPA: archease [Gaiellaceae bacterium]|nr:archease [Gaiellaceae bacterium]